MLPLAKASCGTIKWSVHVINWNITIIYNLGYGCEVKWKVKKSEKKVMTKTFFDFPETYIYYTSCIYLLQKLKKNVQANFLMGLIFRTSWRVAPMKNFFLMGICIFWILCTNVLELTGGFGRQILQVFTLFF